KLAARQPVDHGSLATALWGDESDGEAQSASRKDHIDPSEYEELIGAGRWEMVEEEVEEGGKMEMEVEVEVSAEHGDEGGSQDGPAVELEDTGIPLTRSSEQSRVIATINSAASVLPVNSNSKAKPHLVASPSTPARDGQQSDLSLFRSPTITHYRATAALPEIAKKRRSGDELGTDARFATSEQLPRPFQQGRRQQRRRLDD
ncbi:hypothetical protein P7C70_g2683, partial [Phenoliferia sp. Uapishka_3]